MRTFRPAEVRARESGERAGKADRGASLARNAEGGPAHVSAEAGKKHGHLGGQAAAPDVNIVAHFVDENQYGETDTEGPTEEAPIKAHEEEEAENEFQFEDGKKECLALGKEDGDRSKRPELAGPGALLFGRWSGRSGQLQLADFVANPCRLSRIGGKKWQGFEPFLTGFEELALLLKSLGLRGDADQIFAVNKGMTLLASDSPQRQRCTTIVAIADGFDVGAGHGRPDELTGRRRRRSCSGGERSENIDLGTRG